jgi:hypothetical protein
MQSLQECQHNIEYGYYLGQACQNTGLQAVINAFEITINNHNRGDGLYTHVLIPGALPTQLVPMFYREEDSKTKENLHKKIQIRGVASSQIEYKMHGVSWLGTLVYRIVPRSLGQQMAQSFLRIGHKAFREEEPFRLDGEIGTLGKFHHILNRVMTWKNTHTNKKGQNEMGKFPTAERNYSLFKPSKGQK